MTEFGYRLSGRSEDVQVAHDAGDAGRPRDPCRVPNLDEDDLLLVAALDDLGITGVPSIWSDETIDWGGFDALVFLARHPEAPARFARAVQGRLRTRDA